MKKHVYNFWKAIPGISCFRILVLILIINPALAQITITSHDFPSAGMLVVRNIDSTSSISPGSAGLGQVWDFSNLVTSYDDSTLYALPGGQAGAGNHPNANLVATDLDSDINYGGGYNSIFYETTPGGWLVQGQELKISFWGMTITWHIFYQPPVFEMPLPFTYNSSNIQNTTWKLYAATGVNGTVIDSVLTINHTTVNQLADASGTIITPEGSYEALRVYEHMEIVDSSFKYNAANGWVFDKTGSKVMEVYRWFANGIGEVGNLLVEDKKGGGSLTFFKSTTIVGTEELTKENGVQIFPVPATDHLTIEVNGQIERTEIYNSSATLISSGNNEKTIDIAGLKKGVYFIKVYTPKAVTSHKFIKQ